MQYPQPFPRQPFSPQLDAFIPLSLLLRRPISVQQGTAPCLLLGDNFSSLLDDFGGQQPQEMAAASEEQHAQPRPPGDQGLPLPSAWSHPQLEFTPAGVQETNQELWEDPASHPWSRTASGNP